MVVLRLVSTLLMAWCASGAQALEITSLSPQGEVAQVRQVVVRFDQPVAGLGNPGAAAPVALQCNTGTARRGTGRWTTDREWVFDFDADLPPGTSCSLQVRPGLRSAAGSALRGPGSYRFHTGAPLVRSVRPFPGAPIDEDQYFTLQLSGPATHASLLASVWCAVDGLGERVPVRLVDGAERATLLQSQGLRRAAALSPLSIATLACQRRFTPASRVQLVFGPGVAAPGTPDGVRDSVATTLERRFRYRVREPFAASFRCERENAQTACLPIRPMGLDFNAPVTRRLAEGVRLQSGSTSLAPVFGPHESTDGDSVVQGITFNPPFREQTQFTLVLPPDFSDASGRALRNAAGFPLQVATGALPPLAKFAAAPFGVVERFAEGDGVALLPLTLRRVEAALPVQRLGTTPGSSVSTLRPDNDADIIAWFSRVQRYHAALVERTAAAKDVAGSLPPPVDPGQKDWVQTRMVSLLQGRPGVQALSLPAPAGAGARPFEVVGLPLPAGFHVVEVASPMLGAALLDPRHGEARTLFVRTSALVTNLAVHFKLGRENALAWVTALDSGRPVAGARVQVSDCRGRPVAQGDTDRQGIVRLAGVSPEPPACLEDNGGTDGYFVSARARQPGAGRGSTAVDDMAFTWSDWQRGIEPWRFNLPTSSDPQPDLRAHTVFDRTLLRAGETVSMKHVLRQATSQGFGVPDKAPATLVVTHVGSGQESTQNLAWRSTATGGRSSESSYAVPTAARLGLYQVALRGATGEQTISTGQFRVEEFRLPVLQGRVGPAGQNVPAQPAAVPVEVQVNYVSGGPAANLPVQVSALVRDRVPQFGDHGEFRFSAPRGHAENVSEQQQEETPVTDERVMADRLPLTLDRHGIGRVRIDPLPPSRQARELVLEASYSDPNGAVQTLRSTHPLWPADVVAGIRAEDWIASGQTLRLQALALDHAGRPRRDVPLEVRAVARTVTSSRKRMVGGFYTYDNRTEQRDLGSVCSGTSDARGLLSCSTTLAQPGEVELVVSARDAAGRTSDAATSVYVTRQGELWFGGENHDRMDVLPEKRDYRPGETARLQVRMPFRAATALVAVEREGILHTQVVQLRGDDPTIGVKIGRDWGPNVYVSVLALRGRLREVPWYSFFTWGYQAPRLWWTGFWHERGSTVAPTALVDLARPAFRLGVAELRIGAQAHRLDVRVTPDQAELPVRALAGITISARLPNGQPAAHAEVAVAAVDQALLELSPNTSWNLLDAMLQRRAWGVQTSTAQMEIIGRRHYGRKAVPAGGGGGRGATRELFDTLLLWNPRVLLDARGQARIQVPLNDALTTFQVVAVADASTGLFGSAQASIRTTQALQIISGLPPLVREGDEFTAQITLRNTTRRAMQVEVGARSGSLPLASRSVAIPAGEAREVQWPITAPVLAPAVAASDEAGALVWDITARDSRSGARDALAARQRIAPRVPLAVQQATLLQIDGPLSLPLQSAAGALPGRGGLRLALQPTLAGGPHGALPAVRDWFAAYPFTCLEQLASQAITLRDTARWQALLAQLPSYLDDDGLAYYFPPREGQANGGSDTLSAYLLAASHEAAGADPAFALPEALRDAMLRALAAFVEGRLQREAWSPRSGADLDVRKLAALEALSRHGQASGRMTTSISITPNQWPTHALIDWVNILRRVADVPRREGRLAEAQQVLRARTSTQGSQLVLGSDRDDTWWWLMHHADGNAARLLLAVLDEPAWQDDIARLANGLVGRQQRGVWATTTANLWGSLALRKFSARHEAAPVAGTTRASTGVGAGTVAWERPARSLFLPAAPDGATQTLQVTHEGSGKPWLTLQVLAAVERTAPLDAGYRIRRTMTPVQQAEATAPGRFTRGDIVRVTLEVDAATDMAWAVVTDPVPGGATILGSGLGRDTASATQGERRTGAARPAFEERGLASLRAYYEFLPRGRTTLQYTLRLNSAGTFALPPSRVEAMYAPEMFGEAPNGSITVEAGP